MVDVEAIKAKNFKVALDAVNSTGGIAIPMLLDNTMANGSLLVEEKMVYMRANLSMLFREHKIIPIYMW